MSVLELGLPSDIVLGGMAIAQERRCDPILPQVLRSRLSGLSSGRRCRPPALSMGGGVASLIPGHGLLRGATCAPSGWGA